MKNKDIYREIGNVDEKYIREADPTAPRPGVKRRKLTVLAACISVFAVFLSLWLFLPFSGELEDLSKYSNSEYYGLMLKVQQVASRPDNYRFRNNFDKYFRTHEQSDTNGVITVGTLAEATPADKYEEVTDNQFEGIIEGDLFKRSDKAVFYLDPNTLTVYSYSIEGENSDMLDSFVIEDEFGISRNTVYLNNCVLYLSQDCTKLTVILPMAKKTTAVSINVSAPSEMEKGEVLEISGGYFTSRMIDGKLLTVTGWGVGNNPDFSKKSEYLPQITRNGESQLIAAEDISYTDDSWRAFYTVMALVDMNTLEAVSSAAVLDYAGTVTVSDDHIFLSCFDYNVNEKEGESEGEVLGETVYSSLIYVVSHKDGKLENIGSTKVDGWTPDQYSMDEYNGMLRVVTATEIMYWVQHNFENGGFSSSLTGNYQNASLYCIDLDTFTIIGEVVSFAPEGEEVTSVRFEGDYCYVCTADTVYHKDPVYFFDLSDPANITYSDTGVIDGYSTSLVDMGGGKLIGIGYGDSDQTLKVEVYEERDGKVESVCAFERKFVIFSEDYKSYYINRAEGLVGLMVSNAYVSEYLLLKFDGESITQIVKQGIRMVGELDYTRAAVIDGTLFIFAEDQFKAVEIENP